MEICTWSTLQKGLKGLGLASLACCLCDGGRGDSDRALRPLPPGGEVYQVMNHLGSRYYPTRTTHNIYGINPVAYQSSCSPCWSQSHELLGCQTQVQLHPQHARSSHQTALEPLHRPPQPPAGRNVCLIRMLIYNEISHPHCNMHVLIQMNVTCEYVGYMATLPKSSQLKPGASWDTRGWAWAWMNNSEVNLLFSLMLSCSSPSSTISSDRQ